MSLPTEREVQGYVFDGLVVLAVMLALVSVPPSAVVETRVGCLLITGVWSVTLVFWLRR